MINLSYTSSFLLSVLGTSVSYSNGLSERPKNIPLSSARCCRDIDRSWRVNRPVVVAPPVRLSLPVTMMQKAREVKQSTGLKCFQRTTDISVKPVVAMECDENVFLYAFEW